MSDTLLIALSKILLNINFGRLYAQQTLCAWFQA